jgi:hypothetical protein
MDNDVVTVRDAVFATTRTTSFYALIIIKPNRNHNKKENNFLRFFGMFFKETALNAVFKIWTETISLNGLWTVQTITRSYSLRLRK